MDKKVKTKQCFQCKQTKSISEFGKNRNAKDGFNCYCRICYREYQRKYQKEYKWYIKNPTAYKKVKQKYRQSEKGKQAHREGNRRYQKGKVGKITHAKNATTYRMRHPEKIKARTFVGNCIRTGKLIHPSYLNCYYCTKKANQYHHFLGYKKEHWLAIIPICNDCHQNTIHN